MIRIVEASHDRLRLSDAETFCSKWGFVIIVAGILVSGIVVAVKVVQPACWPGAAIACFLLVMLVRELPHAWDTEFCFDRIDGQLKVIRHPWLGRTRSEHYQLSQVSGARVVARPQPRNYPGSDYDRDDTQPLIENREYAVVLNMGSGMVLTVCWGGGEYGAAQLKAAITAFLEFDPAVG